VPELPEVEVIRAGLAPAITGAIVTGVEVFEPRSLRRHDATRGTFEQTLSGRQLGAPERRGKFLWIPLLESDGTAPRRALIVHLGMSGQVLLRVPGAGDRHLRIRLSIEHPDHGELLVHFVDQRIFGSMAIDDLVSSLDLPEQRVPTQVMHINRDPLDPAFDDDAFTTALTRRASGVKRSLLDQTLISGIGNIYADEALWASRLHYEIPGRLVSRAGARALLAEVRLVLARALAEGGTSFDAQYVNVNGQSGYFSHSLSVYGQTGRPCPRCGTAIVREAFMNRSSHRCPECQPTGIWTL
jgi:formamidopyrimidine-DNA glycosylase